MRPHDDHGRRAGDGRRGAGASARLRLARGAAGGLIALAGAGTGVALAAAPGAPTVATDTGASAAPGTPDLRRVSLQRGADGRLRAGLSFVGDLRPEDLVARGGPPGSVCLRVYGAATPGVLPPDFLVCATADATGRSLRGSVLAEQVNALPRTVGTATVSRPSVRSIVLRFSQSSVGRPTAIRFLGEATRPGCVRASCVDTLPTAPQTKTLALR